jgi:predicted nucleic acid-binding protein
MQVFVYTNILLDLFFECEPFYADAARLFSLADKKQIQLALSALTIANANYSLRICRVLP